MSCSKCGTPLEEGARFCGACGHQVEGAVIPRSGQRSLGKTVFQAPGLPQKSAPGAPAPAPVAVYPSTPGPTPRGAAGRVASAAPARPAIDPRDALSATLETPAPAEVLAIRTPAQKSVAATGELVGQTLNGRYLVKERIGEGGFGTVFRGEQIQMGRECALKVLHARMARDPQVVGRFRREAQAASVLKAAHTVQIYDFDQSPDGVMYLAMELLHGRSLHSDMQQGPIPAARVVKIIDDACESLGEAHIHGIVHRDIKPENIFLETRGADSDFVKVLDFGIAKVNAAEGPGPRAPALTAAGQTLGTLEYMSPEQLMGQQLDGRSDLYALGILAFEMMTGDLPFQCKTSGEMISAHLKTVPPAPSKAAPALGLPPLLDAVVLRLLEKDRSRRYKDTADLQTDLRRVAALLAGGHAPAAAPPLAIAQVPPAPEVTERADAPTVKPPRRAPARSAMPTSVVLIIVGAVVVFVGLLVFALRSAGAVEGPPAPARLVPATMNAVLGVDYQTLRAQSPSAAMAALEEALRPQLEHVGADPARFGRLALGVGTARPRTRSPSQAPSGNDRPPAVVIYDGKIDPARFEADLKRQAKPGEKFGPAAYKGVKYRKSAGAEYAVLPGDRLVLTNGAGMAAALELNRGVGPALVDGAAAKLLDQVGASGGRGPALFGWLALTDEMKRDLPQQASGMSTVEEASFALQLGGAGADLKAIGRCVSEAAAKATAIGLREFIDNARKDQTVALLGLSPILAAVKVEAQGATVQMGLHLSAPQYADLFTRLSGVVAAAAEQRRQMMNQLPPEEAGGDGEKAGEKKAPRARSKGGP